MQACQGQGLESSTSCYRDPAPGWCAASRAAVCRMWTSSTSTPAVSSGILLSRVPTRVSLLPPLSSRCFLPREAEGPSTVRASQARVPGPGSGLGPSWPHPPRLPSAAGRRTQPPPLQTPSAPWQLPPTPPSTTLRRHLCHPPLHAPHLFEPADLIRSVPATSNDRIYCKLVAHGAVHAAFAGYTGTAVGPVNTHCESGGGVSTPIASRVRGTAGRGACLPQAYAAHEQSPAAWQPVR